MKRFSELGIQQAESDKIYNCQQVSITDVLNTEIEVIGFLPNVKTKHGEGRYLVHFRQVENGVEGKFFTNSSSLKCALDQVQEGDFPFLTVIKATKCGNGKLFQFT